MVSSDSFSAAANANLAISSKSERVGMGRLEILQRPVTVDLSESVISSKESSPLSSKS